VNTDDAPPRTETSSTAPRPTLNNAHLVNAFNFVAHVGDTTGYYFTTPSGRWRCAITPRTTAGCQASSGRLGITGAPDTVTDATGEAAAPNAIVVDREGDAHFAAVEQPGFAPAPGPANSLQFNQVLAVGGFRCNVQEATGVSCLNETTGKGFTFSAEGYTLQYIDVPR
jgi:hypothetical protein